MKTKLFFKKEWKMLLIVSVFAWVQLGTANEERLDYLQDPDQDGLTTAEELAIGTDPYNSDTDGDGYSDGVEVESGYDPLKPAPGDKLIPEEATIETPQVKGEQVQSVNLTDQFIKKLKEEKAEELEILNNKKSGEIDPQNISLTPQDIEKLAQQVLDEASLNNQFDLLPEEQFKISAEVKEKNPEKKQGKEKEQIEQYLASTGLIMMSRMPFDTSREDASQAKDFIASLNMSIQEGNPGVVRNARLKLEKMLEELKQVDTPFVLKDLHIRWVSLLDFLINLDGSAIFEKEDPIAMSLLAGKIQAIINETKEIEVAFSQVLAEYSIGEETSPKQTLEKNKEQNEEQLKTDESESN